MVTLRVHEIKEKRQNLGVPLTFYSPSKERHLNVQTSTKWMHQHVKKGWSQRMWHLFDEELWDDIDKIWQWHQVCGCCSVWTSYCAKHHSLSTG
jgi:hypothetical protein